MPALVFGRGLCYTGRMIEFSITWFKLKDDPDPDQTPNWTKRIEGTYSLTPKLVVEKLCSLFNRLALDKDFSELLIRPIFSGGIERPGDPLPNPFVRGADRKFLGPFGDIVPAMRLRYMAFKDYGGTYHGLSSDIQKAFGLTTYGRSKDYIWAGDYLAKRLSDTFIMWGDTHPESPRETNYFLYGQSIYVQEKKDEIDIDTGVGKEMLKRLNDDLPTLFFKNVIANG